MPPIQRRSSTARTHRRQVSRHLLTPLPSLDSLVASVSSTANPPTISAFTHPLGHNPPFGSVHHDNTIYPDVPYQLDDPGASCAVKADVWIRAQLDTPPSPAT